MIPASFSHRPCRLNEETRMTVADHAAHTAHADHAACVAQRHFPLYGATMTGCVGNGTGGDMGRKRNG